MTIILWNDNTLQDAKVILMLTTVEYINLKNRQFSTTKMLKYFLIYKPFNKPIYLL
jgi:hypothetical protein